MRLILFRHGIAKPISHTHHDFDRDLSPLGKTRTQLAALGLARIIDQPQAILSSPKVRAIQTASFLSNAFDIPTETFDVLADGPAKKILQSLRNRKEDTVILVGHEPLLTDIIRLLCFPKAAIGSIQLKKAACAMIEATIRNDEIANSKMPAGAMLHWIIPPRVLRQLAGNT